MSEFAWLIELAPIIASDGPTYYGSTANGGLGLTTDHLKAIRFARKQDADAMIDGIGFAEASAVEHGWG